MNIYVSLSFPRFSEIFLSLRFQVCIINRVDLFWIFSLLYGRQSYSLNLTCVPNHTRISTNCKGTGYTGLRPTLIPAFSLNNSSYLFPNPSHLENYWFALFKWSYSPVWGRHIPSYWSTIVSGFVKRDGQKYHLISLPFLKM